MIDLDDPIELPLEVEEFLSWLVTERGRAANTIAAYRRDLNRFCQWLGVRQRNTTNSPPTPSRSSSPPRRYVYAAR